MKTIIIILLLLFSGTLSAQGISQFDSIMISKSKTELLKMESIIETPSQVILPFEVGQGFQFKNYHTPQYYSLQVSANPTYIAPGGKIRASAVLMSSFCDGITDYFIGNKIAYKVYEPASKKYNIQLGASALFGTHERKLFGGNISVESGIFYVTAAAAQDYEYKQLWFSGAVGINFITLK